MPEEKDSTNTDADAGADVDVAEDETGQTGTVAGTIGAATEAAAAGIAQLTVSGEEDGDDEEDEEGDEDDDEDPMASLPPYILKRVEKLKELNSERDTIMEGYLVERAALEQKYLGLAKPLYEQRTKVIQGDLDEEIDATASPEQSGQEQEDDEGADAKAKGIPQFWVCAMGHMEPVAELLTEEDVDCLENLTDIVCLDDPEGTGFTLEFHFAPNTYFSDTVLTKRYEVPNLLLADEPILKNVVGCKIQWKEGRALTHREITKKQRGKGKNAGQIRTVKKKERRDSFFHFFDPPKMPSMDSMDEDEADRLEEAFDHDYDVAQAFRSHIIPKAVLWFTGQVSLWPSHVCSLLVGLSVSVCVCVCVCFSLLVFFLLSCKSIITIRSCHSLGFPPPLFSTILGVCFAAYTFLSVVVVTFRSFRFCSSRHSKKKWTRF